MIRKLAFHEISQKLPFQGNSLKLQLADYQLTAIFFYASAQNRQTNLSIPVEQNPYSNFRTFRQNGVLFLSTQVKRFFQGVDDSMLIQS